MGGLSRPRPPLYSFPQGALTRDVGASRGSMTYAIETPLAPGSVQQPARSVATGTVFAHRDPIVHVRRANTPRACTYSEVAELLQMH